MSLKLAFARSVNSIAVKLGYEVGIHDIAETAHAMGIHSDLEEVPALSLGASDVTLLDLVNSYCTVVDDGKYNRPLLVEKIVDRYGRVIYEATNDEKQAISYRAAYLMQQMLKGGLTQPGGTSQALWQYIRPVQKKTEFGGKTGTSNNHSDAWFVGVTPKLVGGGWVGGEYRSIHFRTSQYGQGSRTALPIFGRFITKVLEDPRFKKYCVPFAPPRKEINTDDFNCSSYYVPPANSTIEFDLPPLEGVSFNNEPVERKEEAAPAIEVNDKPEIEL